MRQLFRRPQADSATRGETERHAIIYQRKLAALDDLKKSLLHQTYSGQL
jgi:type I restriction enzyme S subunit